MSSKIKVDTIENVAGSGNVSLGSGHNLVVPGNITGQGTTTLTGDLNVDTNTLLVDSSTNTVGILNTAPGNYLEGEFTVGNSTKDQYINVVTGSSNAAGLCFQDTTGTSIVGGVRYTNLDNKIAFWANGGEKANINSSGHITMPNQPAFMAHKNGNQSLTAHTLTKITGWTENTDQSNSWDNTNARFTAPTAGIYLFGILMQSNVLGGLHCMIRKNGNNAAYGDNYLDFGDVTGGSYTLMMPMAANDYVEYLAYLTANGNINGNRSKAWAVKVG